MRDCGDEFKLVSRKKKIKPKTKNFVDSSSQVLEIDTGYVKRKIAALRTELMVSDFYSSCLNNMRNCHNQLNCSAIEKLVCLGIGSIGSCVIAMQQLAFILEFIDTWHIKTIQFYDPILSEQEKDILREFGCSILTENCEGKFTADCITVFYMPHCPKQLTNNLLWKNWSRESLAKVVLIGNSFENMLRNTPERFLKEDAGYVLRSSEWVTEVPLAENMQFDDVFNDTAIHIFPYNKLAEMDSTEWTENAEPKYGDTELITNELSKKLSVR